MLNQPHSLATRSTPLNSLPKLVFALIASLLFSPAISQAAELLVPSAQYPTIQSALDAAATAGDRILVAPGEYFENLEVHGKAFELRSLGSAEDTILNGGGIKRVLKLSTYGDIFDRTVISGFTIKNGRSEDEEYPGNTAGGGMAIGPALVTIENCIFYGNSAFKGGALYFSMGLGSASEPNIIRNTIFKYNYQSTPTQQVDSRYGGGAVYLWDVWHLRLENTQFLNNYAKSGGGGIYAYRGQWLNAVNTLFAFNASDTVFNDNSSGAPGGGAIKTYQSLGAIDFVNSTFFNNSTTGSGGAILHQTIWNPLNNPDLRFKISNSIFSSNVAWVGNNEHLYAAGQNGAVECPSCMTVGYSAVENDGWSGLTHGPVFTASPGFENPWQGDYHLTPLSPYLDAGDNMAISGTETDLDQNVRISNATVDLGVFEKQLSECSLADLNNDFDVDTTDLVMVLNAWGSESEVEDINNDGSVGQGDMLIVLNSWGPCPAAASVLLEKGSPSPVAHTNQDKLPGSAVVSRK